MQRRSTPAPGDLSQFVIPIGVGLIVAQLAFRAWVVLPSWFFLDDYNLLHDAGAQPLTLDHLLSPYNGHLMPGGRLGAWIVAREGLLNWKLAAGMSLLFQALASAAALWMLLTLFGRRLAVLPPLLVYLTGALTVPSLVWWTVALNQVPVQAAFFAAVATWVHYLRTRRWRWLVLALLSVAVGLFFWVKALLLLPVMAFVAVAYFGSGGPLGRLVGVVRAYLPAVVLSAALAGAYLYLYLSRVPDQFVETSAALVGDLADTMIGTTYGSGIVGGPWQWTAAAPPTAYAAPPSWSQHLAWVVIAVVVAALFLRRARTLRAWAMLVGYLALLVGLLVTSRAPDFGSSIGLEMRYVADAVPVTVLALGLASMRLQGAVESSEPRTEPLLARRVPAYLVVGLVVAVAAGGVLSSVRYAGYWHDDNASEPYLKRFAAEVAARGHVDLVDHKVPEDVMSQLAAPSNNISFLGPLASSRVSFPDQSAALAMVAPDGSLVRATIADGARSEPGPVDGCGYKVTAERGRTIPLEGRTFDYVWWVRLGYLASADTAATLVVGGERREVQLLQGLNELFVRVEGSIGEVTLEGLDKDTTVCVDAVEVGNPSPGLPLS